MNHQITYLHCGEHLKESLKDEIDEVVNVVNLIEWEEEFKVIREDSVILHQTAYNKRFEMEFEKLGWEKKPMLSQNVQPPVFSPADRLAPNPLLFDPLGNAFLPDLLLTK